MPIVCPKCEAPLAANQRFCAQCGASVTAVKATVQPPPLPPTSGVPPLPMPPMQRPIPPPPPPPYNGGPVVGRSHWPILSLLCGLLLPGAGQAYNGKAIRAFFIAVIAAALATWTLAKGHIAVLPLSATVGWQILMAAMAFLTARGIARRGGRFAKGGLVWVFLQFWLVANLLLAVLIGLTMAGLLR